MADLSNVNPELRQRVQWMLAKCPRFSVSSAWRNSAKQKELWNIWQEGIEEYGSEAKARAAGVATAAPPGTSKHERNPAEAVDVACSDADRSLRGRLASEAGLHTPIAGEKWHMELRPGRGPLPSLPPITKEQAMLIAVEPVAGVSSPIGRGGWIFGARGHVYAWDGADYFGAWDESTRADLGRKCVGLVPARDGLGYWLISNRGELYAYGSAVSIGNYKPEWGPGVIIGAFLNHNRSNGGVTLVRDDGKALNLYRLPA